VTVFSLAQPRDEPRSTLFMCHRSSLSFESVRAAHSPRRAPRSSLESNGDFMTIASPGRYPWDTLTNQAKRNDNFRAGDTLGG
jgi:hypothetical protein